MTGFHVEPAALDTFAQRLDHGGGSLSDLYVTDATLYASERITLASGSAGKIFAALDERTEKIRNRLVLDNYTIHSRLGDSALNLRDSAQLYRTSDAGSASKLDALYQPTGVPTQDDGNYTAPVGSNPGDALISPSADAGVPDVVNEILGLTSWFSISGAVFQIMEWFGFEPLDKLNEYLLGSTEAVGKVANALGHHADFDKQCSGVMSTGLATLQASWTGTAASAAGGYFDDFADALLERSVLLDGLRSTYNQIVAAIEQLGTLIGDLIQEAIDAALAVVAALAAAGCLATVPGVNAIAGIIGATKVYRLVKAVTAFVDAWSTVWTPSGGVLGLIMGLDGMLEDFDAASRIPPTAYSNGAQAPAA